MDIVMLSAHIARTLQMTSSAKVNDEVLDTGTVGNAALVKLILPDNLSHGILQPLPNKYCAGKRISQLYH